MNNHWENIQKVIASRGEMIKEIPERPRWKAEEEGGCGVTGFASSIPVNGRHIIEPSRQMHNRGNGKGGGIAAVGLSAEDWGISEQVMEEDYLLQIAFLTPRLARQWNNRSSSLSWKFITGREFPRSATIGKLKAWK
ncbi:MAG: hypothetical protein MUP68_10205 [Deltaproteobacteria bacterium]|nr:hypothetical protein [Deltaproteobacteria bacterium]